MNLNGDRGAAGIELLLLVTALLALMRLTALAGHVTAAESDVAAAARDGAREASLARSRDAARRAAAAAARTTLADKPCTRVTVSTNLRDWYPGGTVVVTVACTLDIADLVARGLPGTVRLSSVDAAPLDPNRTIR